MALMLPLRIELLKYRCADALPTPNKETMVGSTFEYSPDSIQVLRHGEHIRLRPQIYVGPLPNPGVINRLVEEALCLSLDEAACGQCTEIVVAVHPSGVVTIRDNGPGLPMEPGPDGRVLAELLLTAVGACRAAKRSEAARRSCCQLGLVVVNALSEWLRVRVFRDGGCWFQEYRAGISQAPFRREVDTTETGLELSFRPDVGIFGPLKFNGMALADWLPSAGVRFESLAYDPEEMASDRPVLLHFSGVGPQPNNRVEQ
jgi:DNA gyrase subunit B